MKQHGGDIYSYLRKEGKMPLDFSANLNPLGLPRSVKEALIEQVDQYMAYPDISCTKLRKALSKWEGVKEDFIVAGNGAADLIYRIVLSIKPKKALVLAPTFSEYESALSTVGCDVSYYELKEETNFQVQPDFTQAVASVDVVFLCNPNNPTGMIMKRDLVYKIAEACKKANTNLVIDECFMEFLVDEEDYSFKCYLEQFPQVILLRAFTKIFAMAGLRLGHCLCASQEIREKIKETGQPWSVSTPAQVAGIAACNETDFVEETKRLIKEERDYLTRELSALGYHVYEAYANYILFQTTKPIKEYLYERGILIRSCDNYIGLDHRFYRIAVRTHKENETLIGELKAWQK